MAKSSAAAKVGFVDFGTNNMCLPGMSYVETLQALIDLFRDYSKGYYSKVDVEVHIRNWLEFCDDKFHRALKTSSPAYEAALTIPVNLASIRTRIGNSFTCTDLVVGLFGSSRTFRLGPNLLSFIPVVYKVLDTIVKAEIRGFDMDYTGALYTAFGDKFEKQWPPNVKAFNLSTRITIRSTAGRSITLVTYDNAQKLDIKMHPIPAMNTTVMYNLLVGQMKYECPFEIAQNVAMPMPIDTGLGLAVTLEAGANAEFLEPALIWSAINAIHRMTHNLIQPHVLVGAVVPAAPPPGANWKVYVPHPGIGGPAVPWVSSRALPAPPAAGASLAVVPATTGNGKNRATAPPLVASGNGKNRATAPPLVASGNGKGPAKTDTRGDDSAEEDQDDDFQDDWKSDEGGPAPGSGEEMDQDDDFQDDWKSDEGGPAPGSDEEMDLRDFTKESSEASSEEDDAAGV